MHSLALHVLLFALSAAHPALQLLERQNGNEICPIVLAPDPPSAFARSEDTSTAPVFTFAANITQRQVAPRIVNGNFASQNLQNSVGVVFNGRGHCTGTIISPRWVLTAAHCETNSNSLVAVGTEQLLIGGGQVSFRGGTVIGVQEAFPHPNFALTGRGIGFDIAAVRLANAVPEGTPFFRLNVNPAVPLPNSFARTMGYGVTVFMDAEPLADRFRLRQVDIPITRDLQCERTFGNAVDTRLQICAGYNRGGCSPCQGDSGGPLFQYTADGNLVQFGIVSFGRMCAEPNFPSVFSRTNPHREWLRQINVDFTEATETDAVFADELLTRVPNTAQSIESDDGIDTGIIVGIALAVGALSLVVLAILNRICARRKAANVMAVPVQPIEHISPNGPDLIEPNMLATGVSQPTSPFLPHGNVVYSADIAATVHPVSPGR